MKLLRGAIVVVGLLVVLGGAFVAGVAHPYIIPSASMEPTLHCAKPGVGCLGSRDDRVLVVKYLFSSPAAGDLIAFHTPPLALERCGAGGVFVKRIAAGPGDTWSEHDGTVYVDGRRQADRFVPADERDDRTIGPIHIPAGRYFVLGDDRDASCDSRSWGTVPRSSIIGRVLATYWPPGRISIR